VLSHTVDVLDRLDLGPDVLADAGTGTSDAGDHPVLARVLERDELEDLRVVAALPEQPDAQAVGHHVGLL
jgi:hypothetical protein